MDKFIKTLQAIIPFIEPYPYWVKILIAAWILLSAIILMALFFVPQSTSYRDSKKEKLETEKQIRSINQNATGSGNIQVATAGDNSPIYYFHKEEFSYKIKTKDLCYNKSEDGFFITKIELFSQHVIPNLYLAAHASSIVEFDVEPQRTGGFITGHSGKREGFWFTNIPNFGGKYLLIVKTKEAEKIKIEFDIQ